MSSKQRAILGSEGAEEVLRLDPLTIIIREDNPDHPQYALHTERRVIDPAMLATMVRRGCKRVCEIHTEGKGDATIKVMDEGRRRLRHLVRANEIRVERGLKPFRIRCVMTSDPRGTMIIGNHHAMEENPMVDAELFCATLAECASMTEAMEDFGIKDVRTANTYMALVKADASVRKAVREGKITIATLNESGWLDKTADEQRAAVGVYLAAAPVAADGAAAAPLRGAQARQAAKAALEGKSAAEVAEAAKAPVIRIRSKALLASMVKELDADTTTGALMRWCLGDDTALDTMPDARAAALRAGWKGPRRAKTLAETLAPASDDTDDGDDAQSAE